jgi:hypothetical protein
MSNLLKRLEKVEELMTPPAPRKFRIEIVFISPDGRVAGRRIIESGKPDQIIGGDEPD